MAHGMRYLGTTKDAANLRVLLRTWFQEEFLIKFHYATPQPDRAAFVNTTISKKVIERETFVILCVISLAYYFLFLF
jgi:hypothetical protein